MDNSKLNLEAVMDALRKNGKLHNAEAIELAGGNDAEWGRSRALEGSRAQSIFSRCETIFKAEGLAIMSEERREHKRVFLLVDQAEATMRQALYNLDRVDRATQIAYDAIERLVDDRKAPKSLRLNAVAWLELFSEPRTERGRLLMQEFACEIVGLIKSAEKVAA